MASTVYSVEEIQLQDGSVVKLKPLTISKLREFMKEIDQLINPPENEADQKEAIEIFIAGCRVAIMDQLEHLEGDTKKLEDILDLPTINRIFEICAGVKLEDPNLVAVDLAG